MNSIKCPHCGLVNFSKAGTCKRCKKVLARTADSASSYHATTVANESSSSFQSDYRVTQPHQTAARQTRSCPFCGEDILAQAIKCKHCGEFLESLKSQQYDVSAHRTQTVSPAMRITQPLKNPGVAAVLSFFVPGLGQIYNGQIGIGLFMLPFTILIYFIFIGFFVHMWLICDAYSYAKKLNEEGRT